MIKKNRKNIKVIGILVILLIIHGFFINLVLPVNFLFNDKIIYTYDYPTKLYHAMASKALIFNSELNGFEPVRPQKTNFFYDLNMFAYNSKLHQHIGMIIPPDKLFIVAALILFFIPITYLFKYYIFMVLLSLPFLFYFVGRNFGLDKKGSLFLSSLSIIAINFDWMMLGMMYWGQYSYIHAIVLTLLSASYLFSHRKKLTYKSIMIFSILSIITILAHFLLLIPLVIFSIVIILCYFRKKLGKIFNLIILKKQNFLGSLAIILVLLLIFSSLYYITVGYVNQLQPSVMDSTQSKGLETIKQDFRRSPIRASFYFLGIISLIALYKKKKYRPILNFLIPVTIFLFILGYFGSFNYVIRYIKPRRLTNLLFLLLLIPFSIFLSDIIKNKEYKKKSGIVYSVIISLLIITCFAYHFKNVSYKETIDCLRLKGQLSLEMSVDTESLLEWIKMNTKKDSVILIEGTEKKFGPDKILYGKPGLLVYLFPYLTNRTYMAVNELATNKIKNTELIDFERGMFNSIKLNEGRETEIKSILDKYNIDWVVTWSDQSKNFFNHAYFVNKKETFGRLMIFEINRVLK